MLVFIAELEEIVHGADCVVLDIEPAGIAKVWTNLDCLQELSLAADRLSLVDLEVDSLLYELHADGEVLLKE